MTAIVEWSKENDSRMGYFPALYRKVTIQVKKGIADGFFDDGPRLERLDVIFANRYIRAFHQYQTGTAPTQSWQRAFDANKRWWPTVLQHLLMGINAHINLDLGIAAAETVPPEELADLRGDFDKINQVLASLVDDVQNELAAIWPLFGLLNRYLGSVEESIANFSLGKARNAAWSFAEALSTLPAGQRESAIAEKDAFFAAFSTVILHPGLTGSLIFKIVRMGERGSIRQRIELLS
ncbi:DUF5995 family protein [Methylomicrobium lacus]|uniref:DUF5995 family protein n=1 Tax=Methylomicrobium lacus TaxID=136992 RepID=UPI0035A96328